MKELYERFKTIREQTTETKIKILVDIMKTFPKIIDTIINRVESCFGEHTVYYVHFSVKGMEFLKVGYTKNTVQERICKEMRYEGEKPVIIETFRDLKYQAKGAYDFEQDLKKRVSPYKKPNDLIMPGKGELYDVKYKDEILKEYDSTCYEYSHVIGLKRTN
jgi:hypothetical protein